MTYKKLIAVIMIAIAGKFEASAMTQAGALGSAIAPRNVPLANNARLIVERAADFGTFLYVNLFIDGIPVTTLGFGQGYEAIVRPGQHILSITTTPLGHQRLIYRPVTITMEPGRTYAFTALWEETDLATLKTPDATPSH
ncbi:MAG TPA: hypothetical protein VE843_18660 [Ktedonobacteraceae bacterium]|nr:hypothetical protein [Ktedonobacteraceae bacterium]